MTKRRSIRLRLRDILEHIEYARRFVADIDFGTFSSDIKTMLAVQRSLEIIGEAAKSIPAEQKKRFPHISWKAITATRNIMAHEYFGVIERVIWHTVRDDLPILEQAVKEMLNDYPEDAKLGEQKEIKTNEH